MGVQQVLGICIILELYLDHAVTVIRRELCHGGMFWSSCFKRERYSQCVSDTVSFPLLLILNLREFPKSV